MINVVRAPAKIRACTIDVVYSSLFIIICCAFNKTHDEIIITSKNYYSHYTDQDL